METIGDAITVQPIALEAGSVGRNALEEADGIQKFPAGETQTPLTLSEGVDGQTSGNIVPLTMEKLEQDCETYRQYLIRYVAPRLVNAALAEDVASKVIVTAVEVLTSGQTIPHAWAWLNVVGRNAAKSENRRHHTWRNASLSTPITPDGGPAEITIEDVLASPDDGNMILEQIITADALQAILPCLTESEKRLILLHHYMDIPLQEIADADGVSYNTTRIRMQRAIAHARQHAATLGHTA